MHYENNRTMSEMKLVKPTESELEILRVLWDKKEATVREVHEVLSEFKDSGYTTTLKLLQIMHEKGLVKRNDSGKTHIYQAAVSREQTQTQMLDKMMDSLFGGSTTQLVMHALGNKAPSADELKEIQQMLDNLKKQ